MDINFHLIDQQQSLDALVKRLGPLRELPLDTEADNMYHYHNRICLFQVAADKEIFLIDALAKLDLGGFLECLRDKHLIMHGSDFDIRLMAAQYGFRPAGLFDTMLAAQLLGLPGMGLGSLVEHYLDIAMPKGHQKSDWSRRPLPDKMLRYAAEDVLYLTEIRDRMAAELDARGRTEWLRQRCESQIEAGMEGFAERDENAWRITGASKLAPRGQAVLYELWHWREKVAEKADRPPFKIVNNQQLLAVASACQKNTDRQDWRETLPPRLLTRHRKAIDRAVQKGLGRDPKTLPRPRRNGGNGRSPLNQEELQRQESLREFRNDRAAELGIEPSLIANRTQLAVLARGRDSLDDLLLPWQADLLREAVEAANAPVPTGLSEDS